MASVRMPLPWSSANGYEAIGRYISMMVITERTLDLLLASQPQCRPRQLMGMKLARKVKLLESLIGDATSDLGDFADLPGRISAVAKRRNDLAHGLLARGGHFGLPPGDSLTTEQQRSMEMEAATVYELARLVHARLVTDPLNPGHRTVRDDREITERLGRLAAG